MACDKILSKVGAYVDGELPEAEREEVEGHLFSCQACSKAAEDFQWLDELARREGVPSVSHSEWAVALGKIMSRVEGRVEGPASETDERGTVPIKIVPIKAIKGWVRRRNLLVPVLSLAALLLLALTLYWSSIGEFTQGPPTVGNAGEGAGAKREGGEGAPALEEDEENAVEEQTGSFADRAVKYLRGSQPEIHQGASGEHPGKDPGRGSVPPPR